MPAVQLQPFANMKEILIALRGIQLSDPVTVAEQQSIVEFARAVNAYIATQQSALPDIDPEQKNVFLDKLLLGPILAERITDDEFAKLEMIIENYKQLSLEMRDFDDDEKHQVGVVLQEYGEKNKDGSPLYSEKENYQIALQAIDDAVGPKNKALKKKWITDLDPRVSRLAKVQGALENNRRLHLQLNENLALIKERDLSRQAGNNLAIFRLLNNIKDAFENDRLADFLNAYPGINIANYIDMLSLWLPAQNQLSALYLELSNDNPPAIVADNAQKLRDVALPVTTTLNDIELHINAEKIKFCSAVLSTYAPTLNNNSSTLTDNEKESFKNRSIESLAIFRQNAKAVWLRQQKLLNIVKILHALQQDQQVRFPDKLLFLNAKKNKISNLQNELFAVFNGNQFKDAAVLFNTPAIEAHLNNFDNTVALQLQQFLVAVLEKCDLHLENPNNQANAAAQVQAQFDLNKIAVLSQQDLVNFLENTQRLSRIAQTFEEISTELFNFIANNANTLSPSKIAAVRDSASWFFQQSDYLRSVQDPNLLFNKDAMDHKIAKLKKNSVKILTSLSEDIKSHSNFFKKLINGLLFIFGLTFAFGARIRTNTEKVLEAQQQNDLLTQEVRKINGLGG